MRSRSLLPWAVLTAFAVAGLVVAAAADRTVEPAPTATQSGAGPTSAGRALSEEWAAVADLGSRRSPDSANACERGEPECLTTVVAEMQARLDAQGCAHTAPFAEPAAAAHADALFARLYFDAFDNWAAGRRQDVPGAWRIAFGVRCDVNHGKWLV